MLQNHNGSILHPVCTGINEHRKCRAVVNWVQRTGLVINSKQGDFVDFQKGQDMEKERSDGEMGMLD